MNHRNFFGIFFLLLAVVAIACSDSEEANLEKFIPGRWELKQGLRNGRLTQTLAGTFYEFFPDGKMRTNLGGSTEEATYEITGDILFQKSKRLPVEYKIEDISDSNLVLSMSLRNIPFQLTLQKVQKTVEPPIE